MFDPQNGAQRTLISATTAEQLQRAGVLVADHRRSRPLWFDGRFLAARDLNREQDYFLTRQADLSEAAGTGIADGLLVLPGTTASELQITPGHGIATGGVRLQIAPLDASGGAAGNLVIDLASLAEQTQLNAAIGLSSEPAIPDRVRSGLFVVALRPVEFSANAIGRYPTQPGEQRGMQDGEVIEAALITLIPFPLHGTFHDDHLLRSAAARSLFLDGKAWQPPINCLPLAIVRLQRNQIRWVDPWLVRRAIGEVRSDPLGLGIAPRPTRIAFLRQYQQQLHDVLAERASVGLSLRFPASDHFSVLPAAGPIPVEAIADAEDTLVQHYFPAEMDVDLAVVPEDELATVMEESFTLPPIPLTGSAEELAATGVLILLPVKRTVMAGIARRPVSIRRPVVSPRSVSDALMRRGNIGNVITNLNDINERLSSRARTISDWYYDKNIATPDIAGVYTELSSASNSPQPGEQQDLSLDEWRKLIGGAKQLWYVRRRNISFKDSLAGIGREIIGDDATMEEMLKEWLKETHLTKAYDEVAKKATTSGKNRLYEIITSKAKNNDDIGARAVITAIEKGKRYDEVALVKATEELNDPATVEALKRISDLVLEPETDAKGKPNSAAIERNRVQRVKLADPETVLTLRKIVETIEAEKLDEFVVEVKKSIKSDSANKVAKKIQVFAENL